MMKEGSYVARTINASARHGRLNVQILPKCCCIPTQSATQSENKEEEETAFRRVIIFITPLREYNNVNRKLKDMASYNLENTTMIQKARFLLSDVYGNAKPENNVTKFRKCEHSLKVESDMFGRTAMSEEGSLHGSSSAQEFDVKVKRIKKKWEELERTCTQYNPPKFVGYFETYTEYKIKNRHWY